MAESTDRLLILHGGRHILRRQLYSGTSARSALELLDLIMKLYQRSEYLVLDKQFKLSKPSTTVKKSAQKSISTREDDFYYVMISALKTSATVLDIMNHLKNSEKKIISNNNLFFILSYKIKSLIRFLLNSTIENKKHPVSHK